MRIVRRIYFYLVAFISLEVVVWGGITLIRTLLDSKPEVDNVSLLSQGWALLLAGLPIFALHWWIARRDAQHDAEERASLVRAIFLYAVRLATLIPVAQNVMAVIDRLLLNWMEINPRLALVGGDQTLVDNLTAIAINLLAWRLFELVLKAEWGSEATPSLVSVRRVYRLVWVVYSLVLTVGGVQQITQFILFQPQGITRSITAGWLANGLGLVLVGTPLWLNAWLTAQAAVIGYAEERQSLLRLAVMYALAVGGALAAVLTTCNALAALLRWALGEPMTLLLWLNENAATLAGALPAWVVWRYFGAQVHAASRLSDFTAEQRAAMLRLYNSLLALLGCAVTFWGTWMLTNTLVDLLMKHSIGRPPISGALALIAVGLPVWVNYWLPVQAEARLTNDAGDHARRSVVRKGYLYLALLLTVVGTMLAAFNLIQGVLSQFMGNEVVNFAALFFERLQTLLVVLVWMLYHLHTLRRDGKLANQSLSNLHAAYPSLLILPGEHPLEAEVKAAFKRESAHLKLSVHRMGSAPMDEDLYAARAVILPAELAVQPPEALRVWLHDFQGERIVLPLPVDGWVWQGIPNRSLRDLAQDAARTVRRLAEKQSARPEMNISPWLTGIVAAVGLFILFNVLIAIVSVIFSGID